MNLHIRYYNYVELINTTRIQRLDTLAWRVMELYDSLVENYCYKTFVAP